MNAEHLDTLARSLTNARSRRGILAASLGGVLGLVGLTKTDAQRRKHKKKNKKTKACPAGLAACSGACVDLATNDANCGSCGAACGGWQRCLAQPSSGGECVACGGSREPCCAGGVCDVRLRLACGDAGGALVCVPVA